MASSRATQIFWEDVAAVVVLWQKHDPGEGRAEGPLGNMRPEQKEETLKPEACPHSCTLQGLYQDMLLQPVDLCTSPAGEPWGADLKVWHHILLLGTCAVWGSHFLGLGSTLTPALEIFKMQAQSRKHRLEGAEGPQLCTRLAQAQPPQHHNRESSELSQEEASWSVHRLEKKRQRRERREVWGF